MQYLRDYEYLKPEAIRLLKENNCDKQTVLWCYWDSLACYHWTVMNWINAGVNREEIIKRINTIENLHHIQEAKRVINCNEFNCDRSRLDVAFLTSGYTENEFYEWCFRNRPILTKKQSLLHFAARIAVSLREKVLGY